MANVFKALSFFLLFTFAVCIHHEIHVNLQLSNSGVNLGEQSELSAHLTYENRGLEISLPPFAIARDGNVQSKLFEITSTSTGKQPVYTGIVAKRFISPDSLFSFTPFQPITSQVYLLNLYHFEEDGTYLVRLNGAIPLLHGYIQLTSNVVEVVVTGASPFKPSLKREVTFTGCDTTQQSIIDTQITNQRDALNTAVNYLNNNCNNDDYVLFFGSFNSSRYNTVKSHFTKINNLSLSSNFAFSCGDTECSDTTYAFVYPSDTTHLIYLCAAFWTASDDQYTVDSKAGTITHEMSHFNDVAGTEDYVYGIENAQNLAATNPANAINNADNHEYFQENGPSCDVSATSTTITHSPSKSPSRSISRSPSPSPSPSKNISSVSSLSTFSSLITTLSSFSSFSSFTSFSSSSFSSGSGSSSGTFLIANFSLFSLLVALFYIILL